MTTWLETETTVLPGEEPIGTADVWNWLHLDPETDDGTLGSLIPAARAHVEMHTGTRLITQTVKMRCDGFCDEMRLPAAPIQSIGSVSYLDVDGVSQTLDPATYSALLYGLMPRLVLAAGKSWPATLIHPAAVTITAVAGYGAAPENVPQPVRQAIIQFVGAWYATREAPAKPDDILLVNHRRFAA